MAITSEIIGRLGGGEVEVIPVEGEASGRSGSSEVIATIDVPAGETWLVAAIGQTTAAASGSTKQPMLHLGNEISSSNSAGVHGLATTASETVNFTIERNYSSGTDSFTGHVYTVKL